MLKAPFCQESVIGHQSQHRSAVLRSEFVHHAPGEFPSNCLINRIGLEMMSVRKRPIDPLTLEGIQCSEAFFNPGS